MPRRVVGSLVTGALSALMALASPAAAQQESVGRIDVTVQDATGAVIPGVSVEISGPRNEVQVTDAQGQARFLRLPVGNYQVRATLSGFTEYVNNFVPVTAGTSVPLRIALSVAGVAEQVEVTGESPVIDPKKQATRTSVTLEELQNIPSSRDPWVVMQTVPSIIVDRVNVGGAESGQQSLFAGKGADTGDANWVLDGIPVTDMVATGATATYWDFDSFQEISISTGGADIQQATPGVTLNFALKTGSNTPRGSARVYFENEDLQWNNMPADLAETIGGASGKGNRTDQYADYGFDLGGPLVRDRLWAWGSYGKTDVRIRTLTDVLDRTVLENYAFKATAQATDALRGSFTYFRGDKLKFGRGAAADRPEETTWNQSGPTNMYKGEANYVAGSNLFLTGRYAWVDMGFALAPRGSEQAYLDDDGVWHNSFLDFSTTRPQRSVNTDGNYFFNTGNSSHELKFGFAWRKFPDSSTTTWPGNGFSIHIGYPLMYVGVHRESRLEADARYYSLYASDTISRDRLTLNLGVRWDRATNSLLETSVDGVPGFDLLPSLRSPAQKNAIDISAVLPRVGVTYALDESNKTQVRGSYAMFASQLGAAEADILATTRYNYLYYLAVDNNGDNIFQVDEILFDEGLYGYKNVDPSNPTRTDSVNRIDPDLKAPLTHEFIIGLDREVMPHFAVSGSFTYRYMHRDTWPNFAERPRPLIGLTSADFQQTGTLSGSEPEAGAFNVPFYAVDPARNPPGGGRELTNRDGYHRRYLGFELSATKRMANRWMARLGFSTNDHREYFDDPSEAIQDPTPSPLDPLIDGGEVITRTGGSGKSQIYLIAPKYQFIANGLYQGPWGVNFGGNYVARQGYGQPWFRSRVATGDINQNLKEVLISSDVGESRLPTVHSLDVRVEKVVRLGRSNLIFDFDVFNLFNNGTVLGRRYDLRFPRTAPTGFGRTLEIMNPRIARLGLRFNF